MTKDHLGRATQLLRWGAAAIEDMTVAGSRGNIEDVDRHFYSLLAHVYSLHDVIRAKAGKGAWRDALDALRESDPLLRYFWMARNSEHHDALLKWGKEAIEFNVKVVDEKKFNQAIIGYRAPDPYMTPAQRGIRLLQHLFNVQSIDELRGSKVVAPSPERLASAGVELEGFANTITLNAFDSRDHGRIAEPVNHLGRAIAPVAIVCSKAALRFYESKAEELKVTAAS
jgi:hypothetical protein